MHARTLFLFAALTGMIVFAAQSTGADDAPLGSLEVCPGPGTGCHFTDLETAVSQAPPGAMLHLRPGTYAISDTIDVAKAGLTILGAQHGVDPRPSQDSARDQLNPGTESIVVAPGVKAFGVTAHAVTIDGLSIVGFDGNDAVKAAEVFGFTLRNTIMEPQGTSWYNAGVTVHVADGCINCALEQNVLLDAHRRAVYVAPGASGTRIADNDISGYGYHYAAIEVCGAGATVTGNDLRAGQDADPYSATAAIAIGSGDHRCTGIEGDYQVTDNTIQGNRLAGGIDIATHPNSCFDPAATTITVTGNLIGPNLAGTGIRVGPAARGGSSHCVDDIAPAITITGNQVAGNPDGGLRYARPSGAALVATDNHWGTSDGPSGDGPGSGDTVAGNIDYAPWQTEPLFTGPIEIVDEAHGCPQYRQYFASLQTAVDCADPGATLLLDGPLTYAGNIRIATSDLTLQGLTGDRADVVIDAGTAAHGLHLRGVHGLTLRDLTVDATGGAVSGSGNGEPYAVRASHGSTGGFVADNVHLVAGKTALGLIAGGSEPFTGATITNSHLQVPGNQANGRPLAADGVAGLTVTDSTFEGGYASAFIGRTETTGMALRDNTFTGWGSNTLYLWGGITGQSFDLTGNDWGVYDCSAITASWANQGDNQFAFQPFQAPGGLDTCGIRNLDTGDLYASIPEAVAAAGAGDRIGVEPGTYDMAELRIQQPLTLCGIADEAATSCGDKSIAAGVVLRAANHAYPFQVEADDVTIQALTLEGSTTRTSHEQHYETHDFSVLALWGDGEGDGIDSFLLRDAIIGEHGPIRAGESRYQHNSINLLWNHAFDDITITGTTFRFQPADPDGVCANGQCRVTGVAGGNARTATGWAFTGNTFEDGFDAALVMADPDAYIVGNDFGDGEGTAISITGGAEDATIDGDADAPVTDHLVWIRDNDFAGYPTRIHIADDVEDLAIDARYHDLGDGTCAAARAGFADDGAGNTLLFVPFDRNGGPGHCGTRVQPGTGDAFQAIQEALDHATTGDTVRVAPGTYPESLNILPRDLTLCQGDANMAACAGPDVDPADVLVTGDGANYILKTGNSGITVDGIALHWHGAIDGHVNAIQPNGADNTIRNADLRFGGGIYTGAGLIGINAVRDGFTLRDSTITANIPEDEAAGLVTANGIMLTGDDATLAGNTWIGWLHHAIFAVGAESPAITDSTFIGDAAAVLLCATSDAQLTGNAFAVGREAVRVCDTAADGDGDGIALALTDNTFDVTAATALVLDDRTAGLAIDATCNDWRVYHGDGIAGRINDAGTDNAIAYQPFLSPIADDGILACLNPLVADFTVDEPVRATTNGTVRFTDTSTSADRPILEWSWAFGDGATSTDQHPTHTYTAAGDFDVTLSVWDADGQRATTTTIGAITVAANAAPDLSAVATAYSVAEADALAFDIAPAVQDESPGTLRYQVTGLPSGATSTTGADVSWTPDHFQAGMYDVQFTVTDEWDAASSVTVAITVTNVNRAPTLTVVDGNVNEFDTYTQVITASDPDGEPLAFDLGYSGTGATLADHGNGSATFTWTPGANQRGGHGFTIAVTDGQETATGAFTVVVAGIPGFTLERISAPFQTVQAGDTVTLEARITNTWDQADQFTLAIDDGSWTFTSNPGAPGPITVAPGATQAITLTAEASTTGTVVNLTATSAQVGPRHVSWTIDLGDPVLHVSLRLFDDLHAAGDAISGDIIVRDEDGNRVAGVDVTLEHWLEYLGVSYRDTTNTTTQWTTGPTGRVVFSLDEDNAPLSTTRGRHHLEASVTNGSGSFAAHVVYDVS